MEQRGAFPDGYRKRPAFEHYGPHDLFAYAKDKDTWISTWLAPKQQDDARSELAAQLEMITRTAFSEQPRVTVQSERVYKPLTESRNMEHLIASARAVPLQDDAWLFGEHTLEGALFGFSVAPHGESTELIAYIRQQEPVVHLRTGRYVPLWSVPVSEATITFSEQLQQQRRMDVRRELGGRVLALHHESRDEVNSLLRHVLEEIDRSDRSKIERLHSADYYLSSLLQKENIPDELVDAVLDMLSFELELRKGVSIEASAHRVVTTNQVTRSYIRGSGGRFRNVTPEFCVMGESRGRFLGLTFLDGEAVVQTGINDIVDIS